MEIVKLGKEYLTPKESAKYLGVSLNTFRGLLISYTLIGTRRQYLKSDLQDYRRRNTVIVEEQKWNPTKGKTRRTGGTTSQLTAYDFATVQKRQIRN